MRAKWREDTTPDKQWVDQLGLGLMVVTDVAIVFHLIRSADWSDLDMVVVALCVAAMFYAAALTYGWWCVRLRPKRRYSSSGSLAAAPLLIQAILYTVFWTGTALGAEPVLWPGSLGTNMFFGLAAMFFVVGPVGAVVLSGYARRTGPMLLAQVSGPLLFFALLAFE